MKLFKESDTFEKKQNLCKKLIDSGVPEYEAQEVSFPPEPLEELAGLQGINNDVPSATFFFSKDEFELFKEYFNVNAYVQNNVTNKDILINFLKALKEAGITKQDLEK